MPAAEEDLSKPVEPGPEERALHASELRYRRLFEAGMDGVLILDAGTGEVVDANAFALDFLGYTLPELVGRKLWDIGCFKDIAASESAFAELQARDYIRYENLPLETKDCRRREVEFISNAYLAGEQRVIQCNFRDITQRKRDEVERNIIAVVLDQRSMNEIAIYDAETLCFAYVNRGGRRNLGYDLEQLRGMTVLEILPEFDEATFRRLLEPLVRREDAVHVFQTRQRRADGTVYPVEVHLQLIDRQGVPHLLAVSLDITDRLAAEQALRESEERFRRLVESSPDAIFVHCEGKIVFANPATLLLFGAERLEQVLGRDVLEIMHPDSRAVIEERIRHVEAGEKIALMGQKLVRLDGMVVEVEATAIPAVHDGQPAVQVILRDVTEKKAMEVQAMRSQRMESIGLLAAGIAHDLNNALAPVFLAVNLLRTNRAEVNGDRMLDIIDESAQHAADMVRQVLTFASGTTDERAPIRIVSLVEELAGIARHTFPHSIQMRTIAGDDLWAVVGNYTQLHQVLLNLCINARDAMPDGGILTLTAANLQVDTVRVGVPPEVATGPYVLLTVADNGTGMPPEVREHIFDPFYTTKGPGKGTGLGLSTLRTIVEAHAGYCEVQSTVGRGTKFRIFLPAQLDAGPLAALPAPVPVPMGAGEFVLFVDDEAAIRGILSQTLQTCGYRVSTASDGPQAVALCALDPGKYQLLITDMDMPIMDGEATIRAIRTLAPEIKVIVTSGSRSESSSLAACDAQAFLMKPYSADEVLRTVHAVLHA